MKLYQGIICRIHQLSDGVLKIPPRTRVCHQVSPPPSAIARHRLLSTLVHLFSSMTIMRARQQQIMYVMGQERSLPMEVDVRTSFFAHATTADWRNVVLGSPRRLDLRLLYTIAIRSQRVAGCLAIPSHRRAG